MQRGKPLQMSHLELALRTGTEPLKVWSEFLDMPEIEVEELEPLFQVSLQRVGKKRQRKPCETAGFNGYSTMRNMSMH